MLEFGRLLDLVQNLKTLDITKSLFLVFSGDDIQDVIVSLNTDEQLFTEGIDSTGTPLADIGGAYAQTTIQLKQQQGLPFTHVTLFDSGDFYESFGVTPNSDGGFTIDSDPIKSGPDLFDRWGEDVEGLTDENLQVVIDEVILELREIVLNELLK